MKKRLLTLLLLIVSMAACFAEDEIVAFKLTSLNGLPDNNIRKLYQDGLGYLYMRGRYGVYKYDGYRFHEMSKEEAKRVPDIKPSVGNRPNSTFKDNLGNEMKLLPSGNLIYSDRKTKKQYTIHVVSQDRFKLTTNLKCMVVTDRRGLVWISTNGEGLYIFNKANKTLRHITKESPEQLINTNYIVYMLQDHDGNIWLSGENYGVVCLQVRQQKYSVVNFDNSHDEKGNDVRMLTQLSDGRILMSDMTGNMWQSDKSMKSLTNHKYDDIIISACLDRQGRLWLGSRSKGIYVDGQHFSNRRTDCIVMDQKGRMWVCGLKTCLRQATVVNGKYSERKFFEGIDKLESRVLLVDHRGNMWFGNKHGLYFFNPDQLLRNPKSYKKVLDKPVMCLFESKNGTLWIGTAGYGVFCGDNKQTVAKAFTNLTKTEGLPNNVVQSVSEDNRGNICIGTEDGICFMNPKTRKTSNLFFSDDLLRNICNERCAVCLADGRMAFGTLDGIVLTRPSDVMKTSAHHHKLIVTSFNVNGMPLSDLQHYDGDISQLQDITLDHNQNSIEVSFSNLDYGANSQTTYLVKLMGYDKDWVSIDEGNTAIYKKLKPGNYMLCVKSKNADGTVTEGVSPLKIKVKSPLWVRWWAILIYIFILATIAFFVYKHLLEVYRLRRDISVERKVTDYKLRFFTNISHEFRTPLTLIEVAMDKIRDAKDIPSDLRQPVSNMQRSVERMMRLVNQLLEFRKMQNNKLSLSLQETDIVALLRDIYMNFHDIAESRNINYIFNTSEKSITMFVDRGHIDKIVYNLLSNAFKYTPKGGTIELGVRSEELGVRSEELGVRSEESGVRSEKSGVKEEEAGVNGKILTITVSDTGIGVAKDKQGELFQRYATGNVKADSIGIGLNLTKELVRVHHGSISYHDNVPKGSVFTVTLPMEKSVYKPDDFLKTDTAIASDNEAEEPQGFTEEYKEMLPEPMNDKTVLVVEDNVEVADMLNRELCRYFTIKIANDGEEALQVLREKDNKIDLVVSDVMMPKMNGFELTKAIRADKDLQYLPIVLLTALDSDVKQERGMTVGADAYITKPFNLRLLIARCCNLLEQRERLKSAYATMPQEKKKDVLPEVIRNEKDKKFIDQLDLYIHSHMADQTLTVDSMAEYFNLGRTTFYNKVRALTGITPNEYLKDARLNSAAQMLREEDATISEVCYRVGFSNPQYFATNFKKKYGITPREYQKGK